VSTVNFSILINGSPSKQFKPQRGLRQGDPLSPYVLIIFVDVLSGLIAQGQQNHLIHGVKIAPRAPEVTHLLFADDSLFFFAGQTKRKLLHSKTSSKPMRKPLGRWLICPNLSSFQQKSSQ
jgi:hypothetical protein